MAGKIVIVGSSVVALTMKSPRFPRVGETVATENFMEEAGGKGTNQALSAARLGSDVSFIGCLGNDNNSKIMLDAYREFNVRHDALRKDGTSHTGVAFIIVNDSGDNMITISPGANFKLVKSDFDDNIDIIKDAHIIGFQLESNMDFVEYAIKQAKALGVKILLDPAPARHIGDELYQYLDYIKPNETEASFLTGIKVTDRDSAFLAAEWFRKKGVKNVFITLGKHGVVILNQHIREFIQPPKVPTADPTGAGDIFSGALMHCLAEGMDLLESAQFAVYAAAFSVRKMGATTSMPTKAEVIEFRNFLN